MDSQKNRSRAADSHIPGNVSAACLIPFTLGSVLVLCLLSIPQKIILGADPLAASGYIIPLIFGSATGLAIGSLFRRNKIQFYHRLHQQTLAAEELAKSEERLRMLAENARDVIFQWSLQGNCYTYLSPAVHALTGYLPDDFMVNPGLFLTLIHPADRDRVEEMAQLIGEARLPDEVEYRLLHKSGNEMVVNQRHSVTLDKEGRPLTLEGLCTNITAHRASEEERARLQEQLLQSQKMEAIGNLAGGISHDFNNLLTVINGYTEILLENIQTEAPGYKELQLIQQAGQKAADLTTQLLTFSRKQVSRPRRVDLGHAIDGTLKMMNRILGEHIQLDIDIQKPLSPVFIDTVQIDQVLMNLVINAGEAMPDGGTLSIRARNHRFDGELCENCSKPIEGDMVMLEISDTGRGMSREILARIFDPFFTTKEPGEGTGLGLSTVFGIVHQNNGHMTVKSELGQGTRFQIALPTLVPGQDLPQENRDEPETSPQGDETILLVEDEGLVRSLGATVLQQFGYQVLLAEDGRAALDIFQNHEQDIDLVLTDVVMPHKSGLELVKEIQARNPRMKFIFMSGYMAEQQDLGQFKAAPFLQKPFGTDHLARTVRQVLDGDTPA